MAGWVLFTLKPVVVRDKVPLSEFSTKRAMEHVTQISQKPHYVGSPAHEEVVLYIEQQLRELGLQPQRQEGFVIGDGDKLVYARNLLARIPGTTSGKALVLLSHYDSAPHSKSKGASDDASGVATVLEGLRAFLHNKTPHRNDIIVLFTDAEELGLNGASLFVNQHPWAKDAGLVLNFEARGSGGPSCMLMEVNRGNAAMIGAFADAHPRYPVTNSLMYSIYKMLPNDTDLTVFREDRHIQGFNFAFIDDHFDYHTAQDDASHLDPTTLAHQGTYLMPLLQHLGNLNLSSLESEEEEVYFNTPIGLVHYPFSWNLPLVIVAFLLFGGIVFVGLGKRVLVPRDMAGGLLPFLIALLLTVLTSWGGWQLLLWAYPSYHEIQHGFTYNGYWYIAAFSALTLSICFYCYKRWSARNKALNHLTGPLLLWIILNTVLCVGLPGASYFIWPALSGLIMLAVFVATQRVNRILNWILALPSLNIIVPFIKMFPVGLGLVMLPGAMVLVVFLFALLLPLLGQFPKKNVWGSALLLLATVFFVKAHFDSDYTKGKALPDSLVYYLNADAKSAYWASYDATSDDWTAAYLGKTPKTVPVVNELSLSSKYGRMFRLAAPATLVNVPTPSIEFLKDSTIGNRRYLSIRITPRRMVNRYDVFLTKSCRLYGLKANGETVPDRFSSKMAAGRDEKLVLSYYVSAQRPLELSFSVDANVKPQMEVVESSFDLLENPLYGVKPRPDRYLPKPFLVNDAVMVRKKIAPTAPFTPAPTVEPVVRDTIPVENRNG
ncbi:MAG TPA: M20/M25/M40 family metallo-hydrolase [Flavobacterium sp.]|nr:M20/M25/M40 family metallo-hydrolase [Flavobacterium sp.]